MLNESQLGAIQRWEYRVSDRSILSRLYQPFWNFLVQLFPNYVHPNLITLAGFVCSLYGYILTIRFESSFLLALAVVILTQVYMTLDAIDGKQARRTRTACAIGELFDHALDNIAASLLAMSMFNLWECKDPYVLYSSIYFGSMGFLSYHLEAYLSPTKTLEYGLLTGPNEALTIYSIICLTSPLRNQIPPQVYSFLSSVPVVGSWLYIAYFAFQLMKRVLQARGKGTGAIPQTAYCMLGIAFVYFVRFVGTFGSPTATQIAYIAEGAILSIPTTEIILCKMADKPFNPMLVVIAMASVCDHFLAILMAAGYYCHLFFFLSDRLKTPLFRIKRRIYCCGVFDMCHRGHMLLFERAAALGDELVVGVHNDEDVMSYKRRPNVSHQERCDTVAVCRFVSEVVPNAPLCMDEAFLAKHRIDLTVCSDEYDSPTDRYYAVPRAAGSLYVMPRTEGVSSTDIMRIVMARMNENKT